MADDPPSPTPTLIALLISIAGAVGAVLGATLSPIVNYLVNERQMDVKMVEIGIGILRAPPKEDIAVIRGWAIDVIERNSGRRFTDAQRAALLKQELPWAGYTDYAPLPPKASRDGLGQDKQITVPSSRK